MKKIQLSQIEEIKATNVKGVLPLSGGTMEGEFNVLPPVSPNNPTTKDYVDNIIGDITTILASVVEGV